MKARAYLNLEGFEVIGGPLELRSIRIKVNGIIVDLRVYSDDGRFFIKLNELDPYIPEELQVRVIRVTSRDLVQYNAHLGKILELGTYESNNGCCQAEIREESINGSYTRIVDIRCNAFEDWKTFRPLVLAGRAKQTQSYAPYKKDMTPGAN